MLGVRVSDHLRVRGVPELHVAVVDDDQVRTLGGWEIVDFALDDEVDLLDLATGPEPTAVAGSVCAWIEEQLSASAAGRVAHVNRQGPTFLALRWERGLHRR